MSINDPLVITLWHDKYILQRGREAIYQDQFLMTFETIEGARAWAFVHLNEETWWPQERLEVQPPRPKPKGERLVRRQFTFLDEGMDAHLSEAEGVRDAVDGEV